MNFEVIICFLVLMAFLFLYSKLSRPNPFERTIKKNSLFSIRTNSSAVEISVYKDRSIYSEGRGLLLEAIAQGKYISPFAYKLYIVSDVPLYYNACELNDLVEAYSISELYMSNSILCRGHHITDSFEICNNGLAIASTPKECEHIWFSSDIYNSLNTLTISFDGVAIPHLVSEAQIPISVPEYFRIRVPEKFYNEYLESAEWKRLSFQTNKGAPLPNVFEKASFIRDVFY